MKAIKLTAQVKLLANDFHAQALKRTMEMANSACNAMSETAWNAKTFGQYAIHGLCYHVVRETFGLSAQVVIRCIAKVADAYKLDKTTQRRFRPHGAISYDDRILRWRLDRGVVSIWTLTGRLTIPFVCGQRQLALLRTQQGESDLAFIDGQFYLYSTCNVEDPSSSDVDDYLGVDLGIVNIATDSSGNVHSGSQVNNIRRRRSKHRAKLQSAGTRSAKRHLKRLSRKEKRFAKDVNHCIAKQIVAEAEHTNVGLALEDLKGIRTRIRAGRQQRAVLHSWAFCQLRMFIAYKAFLAGIPVVFVDPKYTSQKCSCCGHVDKKNRPNQSTFRCVSCGYEANADFNAAKNIRRAAVKRPIVATCAALAVA